MAAPGIGKPLERREDIPAAAFDMPWTMVAQVMNRKLLV